MNRVFKYALMFAFVGIAIFALSQMSDNVEAADCTWDGSETGGLASTAANWQNNTVPNDNDVLYFITGPDCNWDVNKYASKVIIKSTFTNELNINGESLTIADNLINYGTINVVYPRQLNHWGYSTSQMRNYGQIIGTGATALNLFNAQTSHYFGNISILEINTYYSSSQNTIATSLSNINCDLLWVFSDSGDKTTTFNSNGFSVIAHNITSTIRTSLRITDLYIYDTLDPYSYTFLNLTLMNDVSLSKSITVDTSLTLNGQWTKRFYYNGTSDISTDQQHWTGWLYTQNDIAIKYNAYAYLAFNHDAWLGVQLESWSGTNNFTWNATSVASQTVQWSWSRGESSAMYDEYQDSIYIGSCETNAGGMGTFTSTFVGNHAFLLSRSSFLPASTDISDDVWLGIVFMSIATLITLFGYVRRIGLVMIISFLLLVIGTLASTQIWVELWTLPTLFILVNAVLMTHGLLRKV